MTERGRSGIASHELRGRYCFEEKLTYYSIASRVMSTTNWSQEGRIMLAGACLAYMAYSEEH